MPTKKKKLSWTKHPGDGSLQVICAVCGAAFYTEDTVLITDKYSTLANMVVCRPDADKTNPQAYIKLRRETSISSPKLVRPRSTDRFVYISSASEVDGGDTSDPTGTVAAAPRFLTVIGASASTVELQWLPGEHSGSGVPTGYTIERESPTGGGFSTIEANTLSVARYYKDTTVSANTQYNYRVSVINGAGTSSASNTVAITTNAS